MNHLFSGSGLELDAVSFALAVAPILALIALMLGLRWGGSSAGPAGLLVALLIAWGRFGAEGTVE
jgi:L-lactate permease